MKSRLMLMLLSVMAAGGANAQAVPQVRSCGRRAPWASSRCRTRRRSRCCRFSGAVPLQTADGRKCLLVARRGTQIVAVELSPVVNGPKLVGWAPKQIDMNTLTSKWGYKPPQANGAVSALESGDEVDCGDERGWHLFQRIRVGVEQYERRCASQGRDGERIVGDGDRQRQDVSKYTQFKEHRQTPGASDEFICE